MSPDTQHLVFWVPWIITSNELLHVVGAAPPPTNRSRARKTLHEVIKGVEIERRTLMRPNSFPHRDLCKTYSRWHEAGSEKASFPCNEI